MSMVNVGVLISPPLGGIIYSQGGVVAVAAVGMGVLIFDLIMPMLLIEKKVAAMYIGEPRPDNAEACARTTDGPHFTRTPTSERSPLLTQEDTSDEYFIAPTRNKALQSAPILLCLRDPAVAVAIVISGVQSTILGAFDATISLEARDLFGFGSLQASLFYFPLVCLRLTIGPIGGWAVDRYGPRRLAVIGDSSLAVVLVAFRLVKSRPCGTQIALYCILLALSGVSMAMVGTTAFVGASTVVKKTISAIRVYLGRTALLRHYLR
jgi:predicted MFS family arabinose efflux permease